MSQPTNSGNPLKAFYVISIFASGAIIAAIIAAKVAAQGWSSLLVVSSDNIPLAYAFGFWLSAGFLAGVIGGKMASVVAIINREGWANIGLFDRLLVDATCVTMQDGYVVQLQITNLISGVAGVAFVYLLSMGLRAVTGIPVFGEYPGYTLMVIPFVILWKIWENHTRDFLVQRHFHAKG